MNNVLPAIFIGIGATMVMDVWGALRKPLFGLPVADYAMVGRWIGHMAHGQFRHDRIAAAAPIKGERALGWSVHYATGIAFAAAMISMVGIEWPQHPTLIPAMAFGIGTVIVPFFVMQPGMGAGIAASRTPNPGSARLQSLTTHAVFGFGLWAAGWTINHL